MYYYVFWLIELGKVRHFTVGEINTFVGKALLRWGIITFVGKVLLYLWELLHLRVEPASLTFH